MQKISLSILFITFMILNIFASESAKVIGLEGKVQVKKDILSDWQDLKIGDLIGENQKIQTLLMSSVIIMLSDKSQIAIAENSVMSFDELDKIGNIKINHLFGGLRAKVSKLKKIDRVFQIKTPTAVCGVRGSEGEILEGINGFKLWVIDGVWNVESNGNKNEIEKNELLSINKNGNIKKEKIENNEFSLIKFTNNIKQKILKEYTEQENKRSDVIDTSANTIAVDTHSFETMPVKIDVSNNSAPVLEPKNIFDTLAATQVIQHSETMPSTKIETAVITATIEKKEILNPPVPPVINFPVANSTYNQKSIDIAGKAENATEVEIYVNDKFNCKVPVKSADEFELKNMNFNLGSNNIEIISVNKNGMKSAPAQIKINVELPVSAPEIPVIIEPVDGSIYEKKQLNIFGSVENAQSVEVYVNNILLNKYDVKEKNFSIKGVNFKEGKNDLKIIGVNSKGIKSSPAQVTITIRSEAGIVSVNKINSMRIGESKINLFQSGNSDWIKVNTMTIGGRIHFSHQIKIEINGIWKNSSGEGIVGEVEATVRYNNENKELRTMSQTDGSFLISEILNLPDDFFTVKINNNELASANDNINYMWIMQEGENKLSVQAIEKPINVSVKLRGKVQASKLETKEVNITQSIQSRTTAVSKIQKVDTQKPELIDYIFIPNQTENNFILILRDLEPTSGMYKVESAGVAFKRTEGSERDSDQKWEGTLKVIMNTDLPPFPPNYPRKKKIPLNIRIYDRAGNMEEKKINIDVAY